MKIFYLKLSFIFTIVFLVACSNVSESEIEYYGELWPDVDVLHFSASATMSYDAVVQAKTGGWDVVSDKDWCKMEKRERNLVVTAEPNNTLEKRTAIILLSRSGEVKQTITIEQNAAASGKIDPQTNFWDDTHWRLFELKGRVKTCIVNSAISISHSLEFNQDGKVHIYRNGVTSSLPSYKYDYDYRGRLLKSYSIENGKEILLQEFIQGDTEKYIPYDFGYHLNLPIQQNAMWKGIIGIKKYDADGVLAETINFTMTQNKTSYTSYDNQFTINYGESNLPSSFEQRTEYGGNHFEYEYGTGYRFSKIVHTNQYFDRGFVDISFYDISDVPYLRLVERHTLKDGEEVASIERPVYTEPNTSGWVFDQHGNWIERPSNDPKFKDTRTITYFE